MSFFVGESGRPAIIDIERFEAIYRAARENNLENDIKLIAKEYPSGNSLMKASRKKSKTQAAERLGKLWVMKSPRLTALGERIIENEADNLDIGAENCSRDVSGNVLVVGVEYKKGVAGAWNSILLKSMRARVILYHRLQNGSRRHCILLGVQLGQHPAHH